MVGKFTMKDLENKFNLAIANGFSYVAVVVRMSDFKSCEIIINPINNIADKLEYYKNTYNEDLTHKHAKDKIQIVDVKVADTFADIEDNLIGWLNYVNK